MKKIFNSIFSKKKPIEQDNNNSPENVDLKYWALQGLLREPNASCGALDCFCGLNGIPKGEGYIYIKKEPGGKYLANLICEDAARKRKLNLIIAHEDAKHWWITGMVPYRETPLKEGSQQTPLKNKFTDVEKQSMNDQQKKEMINFLTSINEGKPHKKQPLI